MKWKNLWYSVHDLLTWTHYAWMPLFFFDALFLVLLLLLLHVVICYIFVFLKKVVLLHTSTHHSLRRGWPAPITEYRITQVAALYDRLFFIIFFTHTTEILFMNSMFELSDKCPLVCRSTLQCRLSDYVMFWTIPPLGR